MSVGVLQAGNSSVHHRLQGMYWTKQFTEVRNIQPTTGDNFNLVLCTEGLEAVKKLKPAWRSTVIVALEKNVNFQRHLMKVSVLKNIAANTQSAAVIVVSIVEPLEIWFENLVVELSHNSDVISASTASVKDGFVLYDGRLQMVSTLTRVMLDLSKKFTKLKAPASNAPFVISTMPNRSFTSKTISVLFKNEGKGLDFFHERGGAMTIKQLSDEYNRLSNLGPQSSRFDDSEEPIGTIKFRKDIFHDEEEMQGPVIESRNEDEDESHLDLETFSKQISEGDQSMPDGMSDDQEDAEPTSPRYLQAKFSDGMLTNRSNSKLTVFLGFPDSTFKKSDTGFPEEEVFTDSTSMNEAIDIVFRSNLESRLQQQRVRLPRQGNSDVIEFDLVTGNFTGRMFQGHLYAIHKNRIIQKLELSARLWDATVASLSECELNMKTVFCARKNLVDLELRNEFELAFYCDNHNANAQPVFTYAKGEPILVQNSKGLEETMGNIKKVIEDTAIYVDNYPQDLMAEENVEVLRILAMNGEQLHHQLIGERQVERGPLQIVSSKPEFLPIEYAYSFPPPKEDAAICIHSVVSLQNGKCCGQIDPKEHPCKLICPFGFWAMNKVVERHSQNYESPIATDFGIYSEPTAGRRTLEFLKNVVFGYTSRIDPADCNVPQEISSILKNAVGADDWEHWSKLIESHDPDCLILLVHVEKDKVLNVNRIEIKDNKFLLQNYFKKQYLKSSKRNVPPIVFLLGCETTHLNTYGFDLSSHLVQAGVPLVVSSVTKIRGRHAGPILMTLLKFLSDNAGKQFSFGEIMLKVRQHFLAKGILSSFALVAQGDADWNLKLHTHV